MKADLRVMKADWASNIEQIFTVSDWQREAHATMRSVGFSLEKRPDLWKYMALLMAECAELVECARMKGFKPAKKWYREDGKPEGFGPELADVVLRCLNMAEVFGVDLAAEMIEKNRFNKTRPRRHGGKRA